MNTTFTIATLAPNGWYYVPTETIDAELMEYFTGKASRTPDFCKITDEYVSFFTKFEYADQLCISAAYSKSGMLCMNTKPVLTQEERKAEVLKLRAEFNEKKAVVTKTTANIEVTDSDL